VTLFDLGDGDYVANAVVELTEIGTTKRRPTVEIAATTWGKATMSKANRGDGLRSVRDDITDMVSTFANDYLSVNPK
jgi:hypothetical protein